MINLEKYLFYWNSSVKKREKQVHMRFAKYYQWYKKSQKINLKLIKQII